MTNFELMDVVVLTKDYPELILRKGGLGTLVEMLDNDVFMVEFADTDGVTYAMRPFKTSELMKVYYQPALA